MRESRARTIFHLRDPFATARGLLVCAALVAATPGLTQEILWESTGGPYGGSIQDVVANESDVLFAGVFLGGVYRSEDLGETWEPFATAPINPDVQTLAFNGTKLLAGTPTGVFATFDLGETWDGPLAGTDGAFVTEIAVAGGVVYAATLGVGLLRSMDGGSTWAPTAVGLDSPYLYSVTAYDAVVFVGAEGGEIYRSFDRGSTWDLFGFGLDTPILSLAVSDGSLYAATAVGIYARDVDAVGQWWSASTGLSNLFVLSVSVADGQLLATTLGGGVFRSNNGGVTWSGSVAGMRHLDAVTAVAVDSTLVVGTFTGGIYRSVDGGVTWALSNRGMAANPILTIGRTSSGVVSGTAQGPFRLLGAGGWAGPDTFMPPISSMSVSGDTVYAGAGTFGMFRSTDDGETWTNLGLENVEITAVASTDDTVYVATDGSGVFRSDDTGNTWAALNTGISDFIHAVAVAGPTLYVGTHDSGILGSDDGGLAWRQVGLSGFNVRTVAVIGSHLYAVVEGGGFLRLDMDTGEWAPAVDSVVGLSPSVTRPESVPVMGLAASGDRVFAATPVGVWQSLAGNATWHVANEGLPTLFATAIASSGRELYVGTFGAGVFRAPLNATPTVVTITEATAEDASITIELDGTDGDGDALSFSLTRPSHGSASVSGSRVTYTPDEDYNGDDAFTYVASDGLAESDPGDILITVTPVNDPPEAAPTSMAVSEDEDGTKLLVGSDVDEDALTYRISLQPEHGSATVDGARARYIPDENYSGADSFEYVVSDASTESEAAEVTVTVMPVNDAPTAGALSVRTAEDVDAVIELRGEDVDEDALTFEIVSAPTNGTVVVDAAQATYTPSPDFSGPDSFSYAARDGVTLSEPAVVTITVTEGLDRPVATSQAASVDEDSSVVVTLQGVDADGDALTYRLEASPAHGQATLEGRSATYRPEADFHGSDSFSFVASDADADSDPATITITVNPVNDAPKSEPGSVEVDGSAEGDVELVATDVDGDALTFAVIDAPSLGAVSIDGSVATYVPLPGASGADSFTFAANDGTVSSAPATISVVIHADVPWDVDGNGTVDIVDLVAVARAFGGLAGDATVDVNSDGRVDIVDLVTIARHFGESSAGVAGAPRLPTAADGAMLDQWIQDARRSGERSEEFQRGIAVLERLLAAVTPRETALFPNYPNPFNPETWIPFDLSEAADTTIRVYDVHGRLIRELGLGALPAGTYRSRGRAAYWDGKNETGERVSSGIYWYEAQIGRRRESRRMVVRK